MVRVAVLDDYQRVAPTFGDWDSLRRRGIDVAFFHDVLGRNPLPASLVPALAERLEPFDAVLCMRERTPMPRALLEKLPNLKLLITTGMGNASFDMKAATELGIAVCGTAAAGNSTAELTWALILAVLRKLPVEDAGFKAGGWQSTMGTGLEGKTLGVVGLGRIGSSVARVGVAFGMKVIAWSQNLTQSRIDSLNLPISLAPSLADLLSASDVVTLHLVLSPRTRGLVSREMLAKIRPGSVLVNTSRGALVDEEALAEAVQEGRVAAGLDTFVEEPVPPDAGIRKAAREHPERVVATPHIGYVVDEFYSVAYRSAVETIAAWADGGRSLPLSKQDADKAKGNAFLKRLLNREVVLRGTPGAKL
ncbi:phosphoglycerate dehydrogenase [Hyaloraphidium curvatum]|nr:phosphoglycerate dehydrogenase [Hyaloraphidium curvatum]